MNNSFWIKIKQDLLQNKFRVGLVVVSVTVATAALSTISSSYQILNREMKRDFLATNPYSAMLIFEKSNNSHLVEAFNSIPQIADYTFYKTIEGRVEITPNNWRKLYLFVVHSFDNQRVSRVDLEKGGFPKDSNSVLIERSCLQVAQTDLLKNINVLCEGGKKVTLKVSGVGHDAALAPGWMHGEIYAYANPETLPVLGLPLQENVVRMTLKSNNSDQEEVRRGVLEVKKQLEKSSFKVLKTVVPPPATHPHDRQLKAILSILLFFSAIILVLSSVIIANMMNGFLTRQVKQIGIMKAIGGAKNQLLKIYTLFIASMIVLGVVSGWCLHFWIVAGFTDFVSNQLNFNILNPFSSLGLYIFQITICLVVPLIFGIVPVFKALRISILLALNDIGITADSSSKLKFSFLSRPILVSIRNTFRQKKRFWLTMTSLALGGAAFIASLNLQKAWTTTIEQVAVKERFDVDIKLLAPVEDDVIEDLKKQSFKIKNVEQWRADRAFVKYANQTESLRFEMIGIPDSTTFNIPKVQEGENLSVSTVENQMLINRSMAVLEPNLKVGQRYNVVVGSKVLIFKLIGVIFELDAEPAFYVRKSVLEPNHLSNFLRVNFQNQVPDQVLPQVEQFLSNQKIEVQSTKMAHQTAENFADHFTIIVNMLLVIAFFLASVGFMGLSSTLSMNVLERMKEFGIMQAIGASTGQITQIILLEGIVISLLSWLLACLIALPLSRVMGVTIGKVGLLQPLPFVVSWQAVFGWLFTVIIFSILVGLIPAFQAKRLPVQEILGYE